MTSPTVVQFYRSVRQSPDQWDSLAKAPDREALIDRAQALAGAQGLDLSKADILAGLADMGTLIADCPADDGLTDDELELVSAGANDCGNKRRLQA